MNIVVIGSINMDYTLIVDQLPNREETISASAFYTSGGGKGANQALAAKRLGANVLMIGSLGKDSMGTILSENLKKEGIDVSGIKYVDKPTGNAMITVDKNGSNTIIVYPGANEELNYNWIEKFKDKIDDCEIVILQLEIPMDTVENSAKLAKKCGKTVILNPAPAKDIPFELYKYVDIITPNETELMRITGYSDVRQGAKELLKRGVKKVIVTLGDKGSYYADENEEYNVDPIRVHAVDTTAAGDSYNGALAVALCEGKSIKEALEFANIVGAVTTTKLGAQESLPFRSEVNELKNPM